jgi:hypothetical protein
MQGGLMIPIELKARGVSMTKWLSHSLVIISLLAVSNSGSFSQEKPNMAKPESSSTGKGYVSIKLGPGVWHIEDAVHETYRNSMYLVEGSDKAALIDQCKSGPPPVG